MFHFNKLCAGTWENLGLLLCICKGRADSEQNLIHSASGGFRISHKGGGGRASKPGFLAKTHFGRIFAENIMKMTGIGLRGGARHPFACKTETLVSIYIVMLY